MNSNTHWLVAVAVLVSLGLVSVQSADAKRLGKESMWRIWL